MDFLGLFVMPKDIAVDLAALSSGRKTIPEKVFQAQGLKCRR